MDKTLLQQWIRGIWTAFLIGLVCILLYFFIPVIYPFIIGWFVAYMLNPLVTTLQRKAKFPRWLAVTSCLLLFVTVAVGFITLIVANIVIESGNLADTLQMSINKWTDQIVTFVQSDVVQNLINQANAFYNDNPKYQEMINTNLSSTAKTLANIGSSIISISFNLLISLLKSLPSIAAITFIVLLAAFFISKDWYKMVIRFSAFFSDKTRKTASTIWSDLQKALFGFIRAQMILITITALVVLIGLMILKVKYAITISMFIGLSDLLPYIGTGAVLIPWIIIVFLQKNISLGIGLSILYGVILVLRQMFEPKVLASSVGLNPLGILIAMVIGLHFFSVLGLLMGPITLVVLTAFYKARVFHDIRDYVMNGSSNIE